MARHGPKMRRGPDAPDMPRVRKQQPLINQAKPEITELESLRLQAKAALQLQKVTRAERWREKPWTWYAERAMLLDPLAESGNQVAPYPDFPYLEALVNEVEANRRTILWKSRRVIGSWTGILKAVRMCETERYQRCFFIAKKEGESDGEGCRELVWRAAWAAQHLRNGPPPRIDAGKLHIYFPDTESSITGVTSDPNVMRQVSANYVMGDELAFWPQPKQSLAALLPTLEQRGTFLGLSSSADGFFKALVTGAVEDSDIPPDPWATALIGKGVILPEHLRDPAWADIPGFAAWTNRNGRIVAIHYTADPRKRSDEWKQRESAGTPYSIWLQEYEMQFGLRAGRPVFLHEWDPARMLVSRLPIERNRPVWVSFDFGYHNPAMVCGQMRYGKQLCVLRAHQGHHIKFEDFLEQCLTLLQEWFPLRSVSNEGDFIFCCDRAGKSETSTGIPEVQILKEFGIKPKLQYSKIPPTIDKLRDFMAGTFRGWPNFMVENNASTALIVNALNGGYYYPEGGSPDKKDIPEKDDIHDHQMDCLRYAALNFGVKRHNRADVRRAAVADILEPNVYVI